MLRWHTKDWLALWRATDFPQRELLTYSNKLILEDTRRGVVAMSLLAAILLLTEALIYLQLGFAKAYLYTCSLLVLLAVHVALSANAVKKINDLYLLAMTILIVSGTAFILLAQQSGTLSATLFASVALLLMVIPMVPWGLREATLVVVLIYATFTISTMGSTSQFSRESLWTLQFIMIGAGFISLALVARNVLVRKNDIRAQYELEVARNKILVLSNKDPLTEVWNRRYLSNHYPDIVQQWQQHGLTWFFVFIDIDDFKPLNDTYGHDFGDQVLVWLCRSIETVFGNQGTLVRMGGDEFALLSSHPDTDSLLNEAVISLRKHVAKNHHVDASLLSISAGVAIARSDFPAPLHEVCKVADDSLYEAKAAKANDRQPVHLATRMLEPSAEAGT